jgi:hypothetical protein
MMKLFSAIVSMIVAVPIFAEEPAKADQESSALKDAQDKFLVAFKAMDSGAMSEVFEEEVLFAGEHRFVGLSEPIQDPVPVKRDDLVRHYETLFKKIGKRSGRSLSRSDLPLWRK